MGGNRLLLRFGYWTPGAVLSLVRRGHRLVRGQSAKRFCVYPRSTIGPLAAHALELIEYGIGGGKLLPEKIEQPLFTRRNDELPFGW